MKQFAQCAFLLCLSMSNLAFADVCEGELKSNTRPTIQKNFESVVSSLKSLGLTNLLAPLERGEVKVSFRSSRRWIPGLALQDVRGKKTLFGKNKLIVRRLDISDAKKQQQAMWEVALALYQMQVDKRLLSIRSMLPRESQAKFALTPSHDDEVLNYFLAELPINWRDERLADIAKLEQELYRLVDNMDQWSDEELLAARDGGGWWLPRLLLGGNSSQWIRPNQRDFNLWKQNNGIALTETIEKRHRHPVLFSYYFDYLKRYMLAMVAVSVISYAPHLSEIPDQAMQAYRFYEISQGGAAATDALNDSYILYLAKENANERKLLVEQIAQLKAQGGSATDLAELTDRLADLCDSAPELQCVAK